MTYTEKLRMADFVKFAAGLPWSTMSRLNADQGLPGVGAGLSTDMGRNIGMLGGGVLGGVAGGLLGGSQGGPAGAFAGRRIGAGAGLLAGGVAGHFIGKRRGEKKFHPKATEKKEDKKEDKKEEKKEEKQASTWSRALGVAKNILPTALPAGAAAAAALPWSTANRFENDEGWRGFGAGQTTDAGRAVGMGVGGIAGLLGGEALGAWHDPAMAAQLAERAKKNMSIPLMKYFSEPIKMIPRPKGSGLLTGLMVGGGAFGALAGGYLGHRGGRSLGTSVFNPGPPPSAWDDFKRKLGFQ